MRRADRAVRRGVVVWNRVRTQARVLVAGLALVAFPAPAQPARIGRIAPVETPLVFRPQWLSAVRWPERSTIPRRRAQWVMGHGTLYSGGGLDVTFVRGAVRIGRVRFGADRLAVGARVGSSERLGVDIAWMASAGWIAAMRAHFERTRIGAPSPADGSASLALGTPIRPWARLYSVLGMAPGPGGGEVDLAAGVCVGSGPAIVRIQLSMPAGYEPSAEIDGWWTVGALGLGVRWDGATGSPAGCVRAVRGEFLVEAQATVHPALGVSEGVTLCWRR